MRIDCALNAHLMRIGFMVDFLAQIGSARNQKTSISSSPTGLVRSACPAELRDPTGHAFTPHQPFSGPKGASCAPPRKAQGNPGARTVTPLHDLEVIILAVCEEPPDRWECGASHPATKPGLASTPRGPNSRSAPAYRSNPAWRVSTRN